MLLGAILSDIPIPLYCSTVSCFLFSSFPPESLSSVSTKPYYEFQARVAHADSLSEYACRLEHLYKEIRCFKHDYMNILSSMYAYLDEQRFDELKQYFEKTLLPDGRKLAAEDDLIGKLKNIKIGHFPG